MIHPKVKAAGIAGIVVSLFLAVAPSLGIDVDTANALIAAATTLVTFAAGYAKTA
jgi:hypothetical protein